MENNNFLVKDENGNSKVATIIETINIENRNYAIYAIYDSYDQYKIYTGLLLDNGNDTYRLENIYDQKEHDMLKKLVKKQLELLKQKEVR